MTITLKPSNGQAPTPKERTYKERLDDLLASLVERSGSQALQVVSHEHRVAQLEHDVHFLETLMKAALEQLIAHDQLLGVGESTTEPKAQGGEPHVPNTGPRLPRTARVAPRSRDAPQAVRIRMQDRAA